MRYLDIVKLRIEIYFLWTFSKYFVLFWKYNWFLRISLFLIIQARAPWSLIDMLVKHAKLTCETHFSSQLLTFCIEKTKTTGRSYYLLLLETEEHLKIPIIPFDNSSKILIAGKYWKPGSFVLMSKVQSCRVFFGKLEIVLVKSAWQKWNFVSYFEKPGKSKTSRPSPVVNLTCIQMLLFLFSTTKEITANPQMILNSVPLL